MKRGVRPRPGGGRHSVSYAAADPHHWHTSGPRIGIPSGRLTCGWSSPWH